jgi:glutamine synthetase
MFRTPEAGRFECRAVSGGTNLYLALAGMIAAGIDGIERGLDPGEPMTGRNMYELPLDEVKRLGIRWIPQSLDEAIDEFEADAVVRSALAPQLASEFIRVKRTEWVRYHNQVGEWELEQYLTLF